jgi:type IV pilus assembly protein PilN
LGLAGVAGALLTGLGLVALQQMTAAQLQRNDYLGAEIKRLEGQIKDIADLKTEIDALKARQKAVEDLQVNRNVPVHLLDELVRQTPEGIYLTNIKQSEGAVVLSGVAQTNERVSEFLRNAANNSKWLERPELVEIKAVALPPNTGSRELRRLFEFSLRVSMRLPLAPPPAPAASAVRRSS